MEDVKVDTEEGEKEEKLDKDFYLAEKIIALPFLPASSCRTASPAQA